MISVDMGCVGDDLGCTERMVSICAKDSGRPYQLRSGNHAVHIARELKLDYAIDVYPHYGSDVEATLSAGYDIRHGLIGPGRVREPQLRAQPHRRCAQYLRARSRLRSALGEQLATRLTNR